MNLYFAFCWSLLLILTIQQNQLRNRFQLINNTFIAYANSLQNSMNNYLNNPETLTNNKCMIYNDNYGFLNNCSTQFPPSPTCQSNCNNFGSFTYRNSKGIMVSQYSLFHSDITNLSVLSYYLNPINQTDLINLKYFNQYIALTSIAFFNNIYIHYPARYLGLEYNVLQRGWFMHNICPLPKNIYFLINDGTHYSTLVNYFLTATSTKMNQFYNQQNPSDFQTFKVIYIDNNNNTVITNLSINQTFLSYSISDKYSNSSQLVDKAAIDLNPSPNSLNILILITNLNNPVNSYDIIKINSSLNTFQNSALIVFNTGAPDNSNSNAQNLLEITNQNRGFFLSYADSYSIPQSYAEIMMFIGGQIKSNYSIWSYPYINAGTTDQWYVDISLPIIVTVSSKSNPSLPTRNICIALYTIGIDISDLIKKGINIENEITAYRNTISVSLKNNISYQINDYLNPSLLKSSICTMVSSDGNFNNCCSTPSQICSKNVGGLVGILIGIIIFGISLGFFIRFILYKYFLTKQKFIKGKLKEIISQINRKKAFGSKRKKILQKFDYFNNEIDKVTQFHTQMSIPTSMYIVEDSIYISSLQNIQTIISHLMYAATENLSHEQNQQEVNIIRKCYPLLHIHPQRDSFQNLKKNYEILANQSKNLEWMQLILKKSEYQQRKDSINDLLKFIKEIKNQRSNVIKMDSPTKKLNNLKEMTTSYKNQKKSEIFIQINKCCQELEEALENIKHFNVYENDTNNFEQNSDKLKTLLIEETVSFLLQSNQQNEIHYMELRKQNHYSLIILTSSYNVKEDIFITRSTKELEQMENKILNLILKYKFINDKLLVPLNEESDLKDHKQHIRELSKQIFNYAIEEFQSVFTDVNIAQSRDTDSFNQIKNNIWNLLKTFSNTINILSQQKKNHLKSFYAPLKINLQQSISQISQHFAQNIENAEQAVRSEYIQFI